MGLDGLFIFRESFGQSALAFQQVGVGQECFEVFRVMGEGFIQVRSGLFGSSRILGHDCQ